MQWRKRICGEILETEFGSGFGELPAWYAERFGAIGGDRKGRLHNLRSDAGRHHNCFTRAHGGNAELGSGLARTSPDTRRHLDRRTGTGELHLGPTVPLHVS